jgi:predicted RND superfamily exporter protein
VQYVLFLLGLLMGMLGVMFFLVAKSSIHEINAAVLLLIATVLVSSAAVVHAVERLRKEVQAARQPEPAR